MNPKLDPWGFLNRAIRRAQVIAIQNHAHVIAASPIPRELKEQAIAELMVEAEVVIEEAEAES